MLLSNWLISGVDYSMQQWGQNGGELILVPVVWGVHQPSHLG